MLREAGALTHMSVALAQSSTLLACYRHARVVQGGGLKGIFADQERTCGVLAEHAALPWQKPVEPGSVAATAVYGSLRALMSPIEYSATEAR